MVRNASPGSRLRKILAERRCLTPASVFDPISARIAEDLEFEVCALSGSVASMLVLGAPDLTLISLSELAEQSSRIARATEVPLVVDGDHGYGNALNVMRTVQSIEASGASAVIIEDTVLPAQFGNPVGTFLITIEEGRGKMKAAIAARGDSDFGIVGRTAATSETDATETIARMAAYSEAGVDAIFISGIKTREFLDKIAGEARIPLFIGPGGSPSMLQDQLYLSDRGVRLCYRGIQPFTAAVNATYETLKAIRQNTAVSQLRNLAPTNFLKQVSRQNQYEKWMEAFL